MGTSTATDSDLLRGAHDGDLEALHGLIAEHLHPAWRIAVVAAAHPALAPIATVDGFCDGLQAARRQPDLQPSLRVPIVTATRHAATTASAANLPSPAPETDVVIGAFRALPEQWRTALWLIDVEGGAPEQVAPVLGLNRNASAALADRAAVGLRDRLAHDVAAAATEPACKRALTKLPAHAAGKLTSSERDAVGQHLATCGNCAVWLAALVSPRAALRRLITPVPDLTADIEARWLELLERDRRGFFSPVVERAIGAAAAAVLTIGLTGVALLGGRDRADDGPELAVPAGASPADDAADGDGPAGPTTITVPPSTVPTSSGPSSTGGGSSHASSTSTSSSSTPDGSLARGLGPTGGPAPTTSTPPSNSTPPATPSTPPPSPEPPAPPADDSQVAIGLLGGAVAVSVGECTGAAVAGTPVGCAPASTESSSVLDLDLPGLPPLGL